MASEVDDSLIKMLIDLAESTPKYLRLQLTNIIEMCLKVNLISLENYHLELNIIEMFSISKM